MAYYLAALIGTRGTLARHAQKYAAARVVPLLQELEMVPLIEELLDQISGDDRQPAIDGLRDLTKGVASWANEISRDSPVAYVEASYWGGPGLQASLVWEGGEVVLGPYCLDDVEPERTILPLIDLPEPDISNRPINRVLRHLGARVTHGHDEFEAVGLRQHRSVERW